jgi:hypothetical protein
MYFTEYDEQGAPIKFQLHASVGDGCICDTNGNPVCMLPKGEAINSEKLVRLWKEQHSGN